MTHLWAVNGDGEVYVFQEVSGWLSAVRSNEVLHGKTPHADNWTAGAVDGRFDRVTCGAAGLVCAQREKVLYIRRGVTYDNPLGTAWTKTLCDARDLAVGRHCIVRLTSRDQLFVADSLDLSSTGSVFLPHWSSVPSCEDVETHQLFALDSRDNLFLISPSTGKVHVCPDLSSGRPEDFRWKKLIEGPPALTNKSLSLFRILSLGRSNSKNSSVFSSVSAGDGCLWCLGTSGGEVYQLVLNYRRNKKRKREGENGENKRLDIRGSWKKFKLPEKDQVTSIAGDWLEFDIFCGVIRENREIASYAVLQENSGRVVIHNPSGGSGRWKSIAVCAVPQPNEDTSCSKPEENAVATGEGVNVHPSIYPKLPPLEDFDLCCEDGECSFCSSAVQSASSSGHWLSRGDDDDTLSVGIFDETEEGSERGRQPNSSNSGSTTEASGEERRRKRKRESGDLGEMGLIFSPKRRRKMPVRDQLAGVPFKLAPSLHSLTQHQNDFEIPLHPEDIDKMFCYSFSLEKRVKESQVPREINHFTSGYWTVNYPTKH